MIAAVGVKLYLGEFKQSSDFLVDPRVQFIDNPIISDILNAKIVKSQLFGQKYYLIYTGIYDVGNDL